MSDAKGAKQPSNTSAKLKEFDSLRTLLKSAKDPAGQDLHNHLIEIINHLVIHSPHKALDEFEEVSYLLKNKDKIDMKQFLNIEEDHPYARHSDDIAELTKDFIAKARKYFEKAVPAGGAEEEGEGGGGEAPAPVGFIQDLIADANIYQWAGIGFGESETLLLMKSLKALAAKSGASQIRFWGKIYGIEKDYYIAEGNVEGGGEEGGEGEKPADMEARGAGVNKYVYWATSSPLDDWIQLPDL